MTKRWVVITISFSLFALFALACGALSIQQSTSVFVPTRTPQPIQATEKSTTPNKRNSVRLILAVSNQSFALDPVDITVFIDNKEVLSQDFYVGNQHNWEVIETEIGLGEHQIYAISNQGQTTISQTFNISNDNDQWASLDFWDDESSNAIEVPRFSVTMTEEPLSLNAFWEGSMQEYYQGE